MKKTIYEGEFVRAFDEFNRSENFSIPARRALYEYLTDMEDETEQETELDVIAICCDFSEYDSVLDAAKEYGYTPEGDTDDEKTEDAQEWLQDRTTVIPAGDGHVVIQSF